MSDRNLPCANPNCGFTEPHWHFVDRDPQDPNSLITTTHWCGEQEAANEEFAHIVECDRLLDDVIVKLSDAGVVIEPWQRMVVSRWLDLFSQRLPLMVRLALLHGMLRGSRCPPL